MAALLCGTGLLRVSPVTPQAQHAWRAFALSASHLSGELTSTCGCQGGGFHHDHHHQQQQHQQRGALVHSDMHDNIHLACISHQQSRRLSSWHASTSNRCTDALNQQGRGYSSPAVPNSQQTTPPANAPGWLPFTQNPAVKPRKPEDVVGEDSWLLRSYKRNMPPRQLVHRISKRGDPQSMLVGNPSASIA